ncbi:hypothetical protein ZHAS_00021351 [Anopheles sinensis]|uniref:Uncharacterized protein n=1 Tax=Anopheles sinensis TaxID=74873 RepID=A0A084WS56_ANOSI|nr:hypothetical protein ZHAS_00021351 [Anopheles sinensis]
MLLTDFEGESSARAGCLVGLVCTCAHPARPPADDGLLWLSSAAGHRKREEPTLFAMFRAKNNDGEQQHKQQTERTNTPVRAGGFHWFPVEKSTKQSPNENLLRSGAFVESAVGFSPGKRDISVPVVRKDLVNRRTSVTGVSTRGKSLPFVLALAQTLRLAWRVEPEVGKLILMLPAFGCLPGWRMAKADRRQPATKDDQIVVPTLLLMMMMIM